MGLESSSPTPVVFIVDDDPLLRSAMRRTVQSLGYRAETFPSAASFLGSIDPDRYGCVLLDICMPESSGFDVQDRLSEAGIDLPIIMVTGYGDVETAVRSMKAGAVDFLQKPVEPQVLRDSIRNALDRHEDRRRDARRIRAIRARIARLTEREREVMQLVVDGRRSREIAEALGVTERTIHFHRAELMRKMEAASVVDLTRMVLTVRGGEGRNPD